jgi:hypothetical protein
VRLYLKKVHQIVFGFEMTELWRDAYDRRASKVALATGNYDQLDAAVSEFSGRMNPIDIQNLQRQEAKALLSQARKDAKDTLRTIIGPGNTMGVGEMREQIRTGARMELGVSEANYELLQMISRGGIVDDFSEEAKQNYTLIRAQQTQARLNQAYGVSGPSVSASVAPPPGSAAAVEFLDPADISPDALGFIDDIDDSIAGGSGSAPDKLYTRMGRMFKSGGMGDLFQDSIIRNSAYALVGLAAFGFIYSASKERTQEQIEGPPMLPGGSAYESDFPKALPSISDLKYLNPTTAAMSYKIHLSGSQADAEKMRQLAGGVATGPINTTMYNGLPRLGRDPYSNVASSF